MITSNTSRPSATILAFPIFDRVRSEATSLQKFAAMEAAARKMNPAVLGSAWYHDEAARTPEADRRS